ncbi:microfibril-associated glycoprotein 4-like [Silurus meridionalis]|nr:microfibril-associated glycoprotein 4-like [Silurus meridionalis]
MLALSVLVVVAAGPAYVRLLPQDCHEIYRGGINRSGVYTIYPSDNSPVQVYCLENLYKMTHNKLYELQVDLVDNDEAKASALYTTFSVGGGSNYVLQVGGFVDKGAGDSLSYHSGQRFSTYDNEQNPYGCARSYFSGFWFNACHYANPNGIYLGRQDSTYFAIGNVWYTWRGYEYGLKSITMKIRPVS